MYKLGLNENLLKMTSVEKYLRLMIIKTHFFLTHEVSFTCGNILYPQIEFLGFYLLLYDHVFEIKVIL